MILEVRCQPEMEPVVEILNKMVLTRCRRLFVVLIFNISLQ